MPNIIKVTDPATGVRTTELHAARARTLATSRGTKFYIVVWSDLSKEDIQSILLIFSDNRMVNAFKHWRDLFTIMLELKLHIATELVCMIFKHDIRCISDYLAYLNRIDHRQQLSVSHELDHYPEEVLNWLLHVSSISYDVALVLVNSIDEVSSLVKNKGSKIWLPFFNAINESSPIQFSIFLYRLSFNWQNDDAMNYMRKAFYPIHELLKKDMLEYNLWYRIEPL